MSPEQAAAQIRWDEALPKRPLTHVIGDAAERAVVSALPRNWITTPVRCDYGVDIYVQVVDGEHVTGKIFSIQVKGIMRSWDREGPFHLRLKAGSINLWHQYSIRVMLAVHVVEEEATFWQWADEISTPTQPEVTVRLPRARQLEVTQPSTITQGLDEYRDRRGVMVPAGIVQQPTPLGVGPDSILSLPGPQVTSRRPRHMETECGVEVFPGNGTLIRLPGGQYGLIDCSPYACGPVLDTMARMGVTGLAFIALSHFHADHYVGLPVITSRIQKLDTIVIPWTNLPTLQFTDHRSGSREQHPSLALLLNEIVRWHTAGTGVFSLSTGAPVRVVSSEGSANGEFALDAISPADNWYAWAAEQAQRVPDRSHVPDMPREDPNALCPAFRLSVGPTSFLITADANLKAWRSILRIAHKHGYNLQSNGLVLPHHGDVAAMRGGVLEALTKDQGFVAVVDPLSRFGLPHEELLDMIRSRGGTVFCCTNRSASIQVGQRGLHLE